MDNQEAKQTILDSILADVSDPQPENAESNFESGAAVNVKRDDEIIDLGDEFDFDGFQVVRREFFAHTNEPSAVFNSCKFYVNRACLQRFPDTTSVQVLVNRETKVLALMPCPEGAKDSFNWSKPTNGKRSPRQITCKLFFAKIANMMDWNPDYRYRILGKLIRANGEMLIAFDLNAAETYQKTFDGSKPKVSRAAIYPAEWQSQFGLPYKEHRQSMQINIFDGYAVYSIKDNTHGEPEDESDPKMNTMKGNEGAENGGIRL